MSWRSGRTVRAAFAAAAASVLAVFSAAPVRADAVSDFYAGKTVAIVVGHEPGTGFDIYSRVIYRHMPRHIPGNPNMTVQNMHGASGIQAANWLYNIAPRDGSVIAIFSQNVPLETVFGNPRAKFDPGKFIWIGNAEKSVTICGVSPRAGVRTFSELLQKEVVFGGTGPTGPLAKSALAVRNLLGAKINVITGYKGSASVKTALLSGEVHGICGLPWSTVKSFWKNELDNGEFKPLIQLSGEKLAELGDVPMAKDFIKSDADRQLFGLLFDVQVIGRAYVLPPRVPDERVQALRKAFMATMRDPKFVEDARKTGLDIEPASGEEVAKLWNEFIRTPKDLIEKARQATSIQ